MTEISKYEYQLSKSSLEIFNVLSSPLIKDLTDGQIIPTLKEAVTSAYFEAGFTFPHRDDFDIMVPAILRNIRLETGNIRISEIRIIFQRGILKEYGEFMGLSVASFTQFIKGYIMNTARLDALKEFHKPELPEKTEPTPDEIRERFITRLKELFHLHKQQNNLSAHECAFYFTQLWRERFISFTEEIRADLKKQALKEVLGEIDFTKAKSMEESKKMRQHYDNILKNIETDEKVTMRSKYLGLLKWFDFLVETGLSLEDVLNEN